jgi:hypothetical protein
MAQIHALRDTRRGARWLAGLGLAGRGGFYLIVAALAVEIAVDRHPSRQADVNGALALVPETVAGKALVAAIAAGLVCFGAESLAGAWRCRHDDRRETVFAALRGVFYLALSWVPCQYLAGNHRVGSEQQQHRTAQMLLGFPGGQFLVVIAGVVVAGVSLWQVYSALRKDPEDQLDLSRAPDPIKMLVPVLARVGIFARASIVLPIGALLVVSGIDYNPRQAAGMDGELAVLARYPWGRALLLLIAAGLVAFGLYSLVEARYRDLAVE